MLFSPVQPPKIDSFSFSCSQDDLAPICHKLHITYAQKLKIRVENSLANKYLFLTVLLAGSKGIGCIVYTNTQTLNHVTVCTYAYIWIHTHRNCHLSISILPGLNTYSFDVKADNWWVIIIADEVIVYRDHSSWLYSCFKCLASGLL